MSTALTPHEVEQLNARFAAAHPSEILRWALTRFSPRVAVTSSFGAQSAVLLHLAVSVDPAIEVRVVDTGVLFPETYQFIARLAKDLKLNVKTFRSRLDVSKFLQDHATAKPGDPGFCCSEPYKVEAMTRALEGLDCWIAGVRRTGAKTREHTPCVEVLTTGVTKVAPLAAWSTKQMHEYLMQHRLPYHPLWEQGYTSIGCWPCTQKPVDVNDPRSGRWPGQSKTECGIHEIGKPPKTPS